MFIESLNPVISPESIGKLKDEPFIARLMDFKVAFVRKGVYWETEKPLIDQSPLAAELVVSNRYKATLVGVLQKRTGKTISKADFDLYKPLAKEIQDLAHGMGFDSKNPDINIVTFIDCCLDQAGLPEAEIQTGKQETQLVKLTQDHLDKLDPRKHPETAGQLREQFKKKKKGAWNNEVAKIITSDRALREFLVTHRRVTPLLIYNMETLLRRPLNVTEMKDVRKVARALIKLADYCQLYSSKADLDLLGFVQTTSYRIGYTTQEYEKMLAQPGGGGPSPSIRISETRQSRASRKLLPVSIALGFLGIIGQLQGMPMFQSQHQPPREPTPINAPLPTRFPDMPSPTLPISPYQDSDTLPKSPTTPPPIPTISSLPPEESDKPPRLNVIEKPTPDWIFNPIYSIIKKINEGKEIPLQRQNTLAIALAAKGSEDYGSAISPGKKEWHTDVNALLFVTADPKTKKVEIDFVTPFTRDQLSTYTINEGNPKIKLVASLIGKDAYKKEMSAVAGQPVELILMENESFAKAIDDLFPKGVKINIPVGFNDYKAGEQRLTGAALYGYLAERMAFSYEKGYPAHDGKQVAGDFARLEKGLDVVRDIIKNFRDDPLAFLRLKNSLKHLDMNPKIDRAIDEFDLFGSGIGAIMGYLTDPKQSDLVVIRYHSTNDLSTQYGVFYAWSPDGTYMDIASSDPLSAGAEKHFQPISSAIDKIIAGK